jgi:general bacterial porin, GBP family
MSRAWVAPIALFLTTIVHAQTSFTLYGIINSGVAYVDNEGGHDNFRFISGFMQGNRIGLVGRESFDSEAFAIFRLENGFDGGTGGLGQGGRLFGRQAYVGVGSAALGTMTFGRQYDTNYDLLALYQFAKYWGTAGVLLSDNDNLFGSVRFNNAVKYTAPVIGGFKFAAMYAFSNDPNFGNNRAYSLSASYQSGGLSMGTGFLQINNPRASNNPGGAAGTDYPPAYSSFKTSALTPTATVGMQQVGVVGGTYTFDKITGGVLFSHVNYNYIDGSTLHVNNYEASGQYQFAPAISAGVGYYFTSAKNAVSGRGEYWHQFDIGVDYFLSKRTDVFIFGVYQCATGAAQQAEIFQLPTSSSRQQLMLALGMRQTF